jgi:hypothetical protein
VKKSLEFILLGYLVLSLSAIANPWEQELDKFTHEINAVQRRFDAMMTLAQRTQNPTCLAKYFNVPKEYIPDQFFAAIDNIGLDIARQGLPDMTRFIVNFLSERLPTPLPQAEMDRITRGAIAHTDRHMASLEQSTPLMDVAKVMPRHLNALLSQISKTKLVSRFPYSSAEAKTSSELIYYFSFMDIFEQMRKWQYQKIGEFPIKIRSQFVQGQFYKDFRQLRGWDLKKVLTPLQQDMLSTVWIDGSHSVNLQQLEKKAYVFYKLALNKLQRTYEKSVKQEHDVSLHSVCKDTYEKMLQEIRLLSPKSLLGVEMPPIRGLTIISASNLQNIIRLFSSMTLCETERRNCKKSFAAHIQEQLKRRADQALYQEVIESAKISIQTNDAVHAASISDVPRLDVVTLSTIQEKTHESLPVAGAAASADLGLVLPEETSPFQREALVAEWGERISSLKNALIAMSPDQQSFYKDKLELLEEQLQLAENEWDSERIVGDILGIQMSIQNHVQQRALEQGAGSNALMVSSHDYYRMITLLESPMGFLSHKLKWEKTKTLLERIGVQFENREGSRVGLESRSLLSGRPVQMTIHVPHDGVLEGGRIQSLRWFLTDMGISSDSLAEPVQELELSQKA